MERRNGGAILIEMIGFIDVHIECTGCGIHFKSDYQCIPLWDECPNCGRLWPFRVIGIITDGAEHIPRLYTGEVEPI